MNVYVNQLNTLEPKKLLSYRLKSDQPDVVSIVNRDGTTKLKQAITCYQGSLRLLIHWRREKRALYL